MPRLIKSLIVIDEQSSDLTWKRRPLSEGLRSKISVNSRRLAQRHETSFVERFEEDMKRKKHDK